MLNQNQLPGTGSIADSVEFVKKLWGIPSAGALPGMLIPTLSLDEINKKIADLKAVEAWLSVNMNMLRGTIQALEVQSATIVNLQSMGAMLSSQQVDAKAALASGGGFPFSFPAWPGAEAQAKAAPVARAEAPPAPAPDPAPAPAAAPAPSAADNAADSAAPNPNAWWDLLQNQFKQAVGTALMPDILTPGATAKTVSARKTAAADGPKPAAKPAVRKAAARAKPKGAAGGKKS
jgi:hypothetical protein